MAERKKDDENPRKQAASFTNDFVMMTNEVMYLKECSALKPEMKHFHARHDALSQMSEEMRAIRDSTRNSGTPEHLANIYAKKMIQWRQKLCAVEDALKDDGVDEGHMFRESVEKALFKWMEIHRDMRAQKVEPVAHPDAEWTRRNLLDARKLFRDHADDLYQALGKIEDDAPGFIIWLRKHCDHNIGTDMDRSIRRCSGEINAMRLDTDPAAQNMENTTFPQEEAMKRYASAVVSADRLIALGDEAMHGAGAEQNQKYRMQRGRLKAEIGKAARILSQMDVEQQDTDLYMIAHREGGRRQG